MGGRGAGWRGSGYDASGNKKSGTFYPKKKYIGMTYRDFERSIKNEKNEYLGLIDKSGKVILAGTSYRKDAVLIPTSRPEMKNSVGMTHNHPSGGDRMIGATLSGADVMNMASLNLDYVRATASGPNENIYMLRKMAGKRHQRNRLTEYAMRADREMERMQFNVGERIVKKQRQRGKRITERQRSQINLGILKRYWKKDVIKKLGYEYIEAKREH